MHLTQGVVLVTGATGGVGRRVVQELRRKGISVRAMVRLGCRQGGAEGPHLLPFEVLIATFGGVAWCCRYSER